MVHQNWANLINRWAFNLNFHKQWKLWVCNDCTCGGFRYRWADLTSAMNSEQHVKRNSKHDGPVGILLSLLHLHREQLNAYGPVRRSSSSLSVATNVFSWNQIPCATCEAVYTKEDTWSVETVYPVRWRDCKRLRALHPNLVVGGENDAVNLSKVRYMDIDPNLNDLAYPDLHLTVCVIRLKALRWPTIGS